MDAADALRDRFQRVDDTNKEIFRTIGSLRSKIMDLQDSVEDLERRVTVLDDPTHS